MMGKVLFATVLAIMLASSVHSTEDDCWKFPEQPGVMDWKEYQQHGQWYLYKEYIDPQMLMEPLELVSVYDCGKMTVDSTEDPNTFIVRPHFYKARYNYNIPQNLELTGNEAFWAGNATLTNGNMDVHDFPDFGAMGITIRFRIIESDENKNYNILHVCGLKKIPLEKLIGVPDVTFQTLFLMTKTQPKHLEKGVRKSFPKKISTADGKNTFKLQKVIQDKRCDKLSMLASENSKEDDCWKFPEQPGVIDWKDYQEHGQWYLYKEYIDPPKLMKKKLVSAYDCGKFAVESTEDPNAVIVRPHFYKARYDHKTKELQLAGKEQYWDTNATLTNGNLDVPDFPEFGTMGVTIRFRIIASDNKNYNILHVCGLQKIPKEASGLKHDVTFQTVFLMTKTQPKNFGRSVRKSLPRDISTAEGKLIKLRKVIQDDRCDKL